jgi:hypothetical protein
LRCTRLNTGHLIYVARSPGITPDQTSRAGAGCG